MIVVHCLCMMKVDNEPFLLPYISLLQKNGDNWHLDLLYRSRSLLRRCTWYTILTGKEQSCQWSRKGPPLDPNSLQPKQVDVGSTIEGNHVACGKPLFLVGRSCPQELCCNCKWSHMSEVLGTSKCKSSSTISFDNRA